jgi:hypothetical protein
MAQRESLDVHEEEGLVAETEILLASAQRASGAPDLAGCRGGRGCFRRGVCSVHAGGIDESCC